MSRIVDIDDPESWPPDVEPIVRSAVETLDDDSWREYPHDYLGWTHHEAEEWALREVLADDRIVGYHATRLLPHEIERISEVHGLEVLTEELRRRKVSEALDHFPDAFETDDPTGEVLLASGPNSWQGTEDVRVNRMMFVAPWIMFSHDAWGLMNILDTWGGETLGWLRNGRGSSDLLVNLTAESEPAIVEIAVRVDSLNLTTLLPAFAGRLYELDADYSREWVTTESVPSEFVLDVITPNSPRWPDTLSEYLPG